MFKLKNIVSKDTLKSLYYTLAYPYFTYFNVVWGNTFKTYMSPLIILQKRIIRILNGNVSRLAHTEPLFKNNKFWNSMYFTNIKLHNSCLTLSKETYLKYSMTCLCITRMFTIIIPGNHTCFIFLKSAQTSVKKTLRYEGPVIWNKLQNNVNINCSLCSFKRQLKLLLWNV